MCKAEILDLLPKLGRDDRHEVFDRLCDLEEAESTESDQRLVDQARRSGPALPATPEAWKNALQRGWER